MKNRTNRARYAAFFMLIAVMQLSAAAQESTVRSWWNWASSGVSSWWNSLSGRDKAITGACIGAACIGTALAGGYFVKNARQAKQAGKTSPQPMEIPQQQSTETPTYVPGGTSPQVVLSPVEEGMRYLQTDGNTLDEQEIYFSENKLKESRRTILDNFLTSLQNGLAKGIAAYHILHVNAEHPLKLVIVGPGGTPSINFDEHITLNQNGGGVLAGGSIGKLYLIGFNDKNDNYAIREYSSADDIATSTQGITTTEALAEYLWNVRADSAHELVMIPMKYLFTKIRDRW